MSMLYKQKINAMKQATAHSGDLELNNDLDDAEGINVELYHAMKISQQKRRSNNVNKIH
jgi:hypothetical protein